MGVVKKLKSSRNKLRHRICHIKSKIAKHSIFRQQHCCIKKTENNFLSKNKDHYHPDLSHTSLCNTIDI